MFISVLWCHCIATLSFTRLKPTTTIILSFGKQTLQEGMGCLLSGVATGVFVHCWSSLLSSICCYSLAWKQDQECFHTYAHWPLINKSDRGPFPHIHTTWRKTKSIHTETRRLITETSQSPLSRSPHLSADQTQQPIFLSTKAGSLYGDVSIEFLFYRFNNYCQRLFPSDSTTEHKSCSCQLVTF